MARFECLGLAEYMTKLVKLEASEVIRGVCKYGLYEGAAVVADAIKARTPVLNGYLRESMALTPMVSDEDYIYTKIVFKQFLPGVSAGRIYYYKGRIREYGAGPNASKATILERGNSHVPAKPFIRPAVNASRKAAIAAMDKAVLRKIDEIMNE